MKSCITNKEYSMKKLLILLIIFVLFSCQRNKSENTGSSETEVTEETEITTEIETSDSSSAEEETIEEEPESEEPDLMEIYPFEISNGTITEDYSVSDIINVHTSIDFDWPQELITENYFDKVWGGIRVFLKDDIDTEEKIILTAKGGTNEYKKELQLIKISGYSDEEFMGYYAEVEFENKPWLNNSNDRYKWQIIVNSGEEELINDELKMDTFTNMFYSRLDRTPFTVNNLRTARINTKYTYRFRTEDADLLAVYLYIEIHEPHYGSIYKPVMYILPETTNNYFTDITISWIGEEQRGIYYIGRYKISNLPKEERRFPVFDRIELR